MIPPFRGRRVLTSYLQLVRPRFRHRVRHRLCRCVDRVALSGSNHPVSTITASYSAKRDRLLELVSAYLFVGAATCTLLRTAFAGIRSAETRDSDLRGACGAPSSRASLVAGSMSVASAAGGHGDRQLRPDVGDTINSDGAYRRSSSAGRFRATRSSQSSSSRCRCSLAALSAWLGYLARSSSSAVV